MQEEWAARYSFSLCCSKCSTKGTQGQEPLRSICIANTSNPVRESGTRRWFTRVGVLRAGFFFFGTMLRASLELWQSLVCASIVIVRQQIKRKGQGQSKTKQTKPPNKKPKHTRRLPMILPSCEACFFLSCIAERAKHSRSTTASCEACGFPVRGCMECFRHWPWLRPLLPMIMVPQGCEDSTLLWWT